MLRRAGLALAALLGATAPRAELSVTTDERVFVDPSRPTPENGSFPGAPDRTLRTLLWIPSGPCGGADPCAPYPLLLMAHGYGGLPEKFDAFASALAAAGYLVAAPAFPLTNQNAPGGFLTGVVDFDRQPGDLVFVVSQLLEASARPGDSLSGLLDPEALTALGHSLGGATLLALAHTDCCGSVPLRAAILASTVAGVQALAETLGGTAIDSGPPTLVLHGIDDPLIPFETAFQLYDEIPSPKALVGVAGAGHADLLESQAVPPLPARVAAQRAVAGFLDARVRGRTAQWALDLSALQAGGHTVLSAPFPVPLLPTRALLLLAGALAMSGGVLVARRAPRAAPGD